MYIALSCAYMSGLFTTLMENDAAQHASMAMKMVLNNDFLHIFKGNDPYLDKPHLHFWLAALSMKLFGINHVAYRIPSLIFLALAAFCTHNLTKRFYKNDQIAHLAALMFLSAQTIILSAHDVRTDAILTGAVALGICYSVSFIQRGRVTDALVAGTGIGMAFGSKGMVGVGIVALCVFCYLLYSREWKKFFRVRVLAGLAAFVVTASPVLYAYYLQFDLHPELVVRGETGVSGVRFILWDQSFKRFSGEDFGQSSPDYLFFFHTLLWVFIPFSALFYGGIFRRTFYFFRSRFRKSDGVEFLTTGGFWLVMLLFSFSKFKLPHYLNSLIPVIAIPTAAYLYSLKGQITLRVYWGINIFLFITGMGLMIYLGGFVFETRNSVLLIPVLLGTGFIVRQSFLLKNLNERIAVTGVLFAATFNFFLNTQFYPPLSEYQAGVQTAAFLKKENMNPKAVVMPEDYTNWTLDFYTQTNIRRVPLNEVESAGEALIFIRREDIGSGMKYEPLDTAWHYRITMLKSEFLNPATRQEQLIPYELIKQE